MTKKEFNNWLQDCKIDNEIENLIYNDIKPLCRHWVDSDDIKDIEKAIKNLVIKYSKSK